MAQPVRVSDDPSSLTRWVVAHPALWGLFSGLAALCVFRLFDGEYPVAWLAASARFGSFNYVLWRRLRPWAPTAGLRSATLSQDGTSIAPNCRYTPAGRDASPTEWRPAAFGRRHQAGVRGQWATRLLDVVIGHLVGVVRCREGQAAADASACEHPGARLGAFAELTSSVPCRRLGPSDGNARDPESEPTTVTAVVVVCRSVRRWVAARSSGSTTVLLETPATSLTSGSEVGNGEQWHRVP